MDKNLGKIQPVEITQEMRKSYLDYAMSVIVARALPDVRDGLKPVHRRILYSMHQMGLSHTSRYSKSAKVVGECFVKDTFILTEKGLTPIQKINIGDQVYTQNGLNKVIQLYEMPKKPLLKITLENGLSNIVTPSQKFKILTPEWKFKWKKAKNLTKNDYIALRATFPEITRQAKLIKTEKDQPAYLNENLAYLLGIFASDGWISEEYGRNKHPRISFTSGNSQAIAKKIVDIFEKEFKYRPTIEARDYSSKKCYILRINRKIINEFFIANFSLKGQKALTKKIPWQIFCSPPNIIFSFISGLIDGDGYVSSKRNLVQYTSISEILTDQLLILLHHLGIFASKYSQKPAPSHYFNKQKIEGKQKSYSLEIRGENALKLTGKLKLAEINKSKRLLDKKISEKGNWGKYEIIPYAGKILFQELSDAHLGGGWYGGINGDKFRMGIKYDGGCKIRYSSNLQEKPLRKPQIINWRIKDKLKLIGSPHHEFLDHIIQDKIYFLKIFSIKTTVPEKTYDIEVENDHEFIANGVISHNCMGKYHPHGDMAIYDSLVRLAQDFSMRYPLVDGQGNFGCFTKDTKVKLTDGRNLSFERLIKEYKNGKKNYTYTVNRLGLISIAEIKNPRLTKKNTEIIKVVLDNKEEIRCTPNHRFMLRDGTYKEAKNLKPGESLMPIYQKLSKKTDELNRDGYILIYQNKRNEWTPTHHLADKYNLKEDLLLKELNYNHKVLKIEFLNQKEDVYDLTIENTHNFALAAGIFVHNSVDGDSAAAFRYTEVRLAKITQEIITDIDKGTVDFQDNFDGSLKEPIFLPAKIPNLLLMGSDGIAVGMATKIPPHNLGEVTDALVFMIEKGKVVFPQSSSFEIKKIELDEDQNQKALEANFESNVSIEEDLMKFIKGPDFPTAASIYNKKDILQAYATGNGKIIIRAKAEIEEDKEDKFRIVISEIPYQVNKANLVAKIAQLAKERKIDGITDLRDESDRQGLRIVVELKKSARPKTILNNLYKSTQMQISYPVNMVALVDGVPLTLNLKQILTEFIRHRQRVVTKRTIFELDEAKKQAHILEGLKIAIDNLDEVISTIKKSKDAQEAKVNLMNKFRLTEIQANAILEMQLRRLAALERKKIEDEYTETIKKIEYLVGLLATPKKILDIIKKEVLEIKEKYADPRRTKVYAQALENFNEEDLIPQQDCLIILTKGGYVKRVPVGTYRSQKRGGKGVSGMTTKPEDEVMNFLTAQTHDSILFFTNKGRVFSIRVWELPEGSRQAKGQALVNLINIAQDEKIQSVLTLSSQTQQDKNQFLLMVTKKGVVKKTYLKSFANIRTSGLIAIKLNKDDELCWIKLTDEDHHVLLVSHQGKSIRFKERDVRPTGRDTMGVRGIRLKKDDFVIGMEVFSPVLEKTKDKRRKNFRDILVVMENGLGKRTSLTEYRLQKRGGIGIRVAHVSPKTGKIIACRMIDQNLKQIILTSKRAQVIKLPIKNVPRLGRDTQGVIFMRFNKPGDTVAAVTCLE